MFTEYFTPIALAVFFAALTAPISQARAEGFDHSGLDAVLRKHVDTSGMVDYSGLLKDRKPLDDYIALLGAADRKAVQGWPRNEQMAFYINAYNAITIQRIIDHYPPKGSGLWWPKISIKNISGVWKRIKTPVAGRNLTLDQIEHDILRPVYKDARVHCVIVCAAMSCPIIEAEAYTAEGLEERLDRAARRFVSDHSKNDIDPQSRLVTISSVFDWFAEDFESYASEVPAAAKGPRKMRSLAGSLGFIARYNPEAREFLRSGDYKVKIADYDWSLNTQ